MSYLKKGLAIALMGVLFSLSVHAQQKNVSSSANGWFMLLNELRLSQRWSVSNEVHIRRAEVVESWQQFLLRPALTYGLHPNVDVSVGYSYIKSYPYGEQPVKMAVSESNIWQQLLLKHGIGNLSVSHRYRMEERFIDRILPTEEGMYERNGTNYAQRFRYRLTARLPLKNLGKQRELFALVFDELWVNLENNLMVESFNQNWFYAGIGYQFNEMGNIQAGYLDQVIRKADGVHYERNPTISVALFYNFDLRKQ